MAHKVSFEIDDKNEEAFLHVDEQVFRIEFTFASIQVFYDSFHLNPIFEPIGADPTRLMALLYVGLMKHSPDLEIAVVKEWFTPKNALRMFKGTMDAFRLFLPPVDKEAEQPADPLRA